MEGTCSAREPLPLGSFVLVSLGFHTKQGLAVNIGVTFLVAYSQFPLTIQPGGLKQKSLNREPVLEWLPVSRFGRAVPIALSL